MDMAHYNENVHETMWELIDELITRKDAAKRLAQLSKSSCNWMYTIIFRVLPVIRGSLSFICKHGIGIETFI